MFKEDKLSSGMQERLEGLEPAVQKAVPVVQFILCQKPIVLISCIFQRLCSSKLLDGFGIKLSVILLHFPFNAGRICPVSFLLLVVCVLYLYNNPLTLSRLF